MYPTPFDNGRIQSLCRLNVNSSMQQGHHAAMMWAVAANTVVIINRFVYCQKVVTLEVLGPGSVLVSRGRRESPGKEECL